MVCNGCRYRIKKLDETRKTSNCGISTIFEVTNVSSRSDKHLELSKNLYNGYLEDIFQCDFKSFKVVLFVVKWYRLRLNQRDPDRTIIEHDNGFTMVNTRLFELGTEPYVLPSQCEQVFYSEVPGKVGWSFVVRHDPKGRAVKYNLDDGNEEGSMEEEYDDEEHDQLELADNADEDYSNDDTMNAIDDDDDDDMANPYNVDYVSDEEDSEMDEENDEIY